MVNESWAERWSSGGLVTFSGLIAVRWSGNVSPLGVIRGLFGGQVCVQVLTHSEHIYPGTDAGPESSKV